MHFSPEALSDVEDAESNELGMVSKSFWNQRGACGNILVHIQFVCARDICIVYVSMPSVL